MKGTLLQTVEEDLELVKSAELFAKKKHSGMMRKNGAAYSKHLEDAVNRLKSLGVVEEELLCTGWLHDVIEHTDTSFDDLFEKFGTRICSLGVIFIKRQFIAKETKRTNLCQTAQRSIHRYKDYQTV